MNPTRLYFYPRPPGGGRRAGRKRNGGADRISIHALRVEGDKAPDRAGDHGRISIHALRVEGDAIVRSPIPDFPISIHALRVEGDFPLPAFYRFHKISIHALRVEGDTMYKALCLKSTDFYPRPPGGGRPTPLKQSRSGARHFYPRPPGGGRHRDLSLRYRSQKNFYPRPPGGGRQQKRIKFSSVFAQKGEEFASLRRGKRKICRWRFKKDKFWVLIWCEGSGKSVCALASHCG